MEKIPQGSRKVTDKRNMIKYHFGLAREELNEVCESSWIASV